MEVHAHRVDIDTVKKKKKKREIFCFREQTLYITCKLAFFCFLKHKDKSKCSNKEITEDQKHYHIPLYSHMTSGLTSISLFGFFLYFHSVFLQCLLKVHTSPKPKQQHINLVCFQEDIWTERAVGGSGEFVSTDSESLYCSLMDPILSYARCTTRRLSPASACVHIIKAGAGTKTEDKGYLSKQRAAVT